MTAVEQCLDVFRRHLHMPDAGALLVTMAAVAANRADGDPLWLMLVGPPGGGKSEVLGALSPLPDVHPAATITEAALLSGTPKREVASSSKGGLLREIGESGIIVAKDFGSVLSMHRDARGAVLAALREVYDGSWTRHVGTDGGRTLSWIGKVGFIGGCTPAIDSHHAVMGTMGERFVLFRLPPLDAAAQARRALEHIGTERQMRVDLAKAVGDVLNAADMALTTARPDQAVRGRIVTLSTLAVKCRAAVERDGYSRELELIPESEAPARLALVLLRLFNGLRAIGVDDTTAWSLVVKAALDSMPQIRRGVLEKMYATPDGTTTTIAEAISYPTSTTRRACEDLAGHGVLTRTAGGNGKADSWSMSDWTRQHWRTVSEMSADHESGLESVPEMSDGHTNTQVSAHMPLSLNTPLRPLEDFSGTVSDDAPPLTDDDYDRMSGADLEVA